MPFAFPKKLEFPFCDVQAAKIADKKHFRYWNKKRKRKGDWKIYGAISSIMLNTFIWCASLNIEWHLSFPFYIFQNDSINRNCLLFLFCTFSVYVICVDRSKTLFRPGIYWIFIIHDVKGHHILRFVVKLRVMWWLAKIQRRSVCIHFCILFQAISHFIVVIYVFEILVLMSVYITTKNSWHF